MNMADLQHLSTANQLLAEFILISTVSYHPPIKLAWFIHCYLDVSGFAQIGLTFYLELFKLMDVFKINDYPENFINSYFKTFLDNENRIQETVITVLKKP